MARQERFHRAVAGASGSLTLIIFYVVFVAPRSVAALHMGIICGGSAAVMIALPAALVSGARSGCAGVRVKAPMLCALIGLL